MARKTRIVPNGEPGVHEVEWSRAVQALTWLAGAVILATLSLCVAGLQRLIVVTQIVEVHTEQIGSVKQEIGSMRQAVTAHDAWAQAQRTRLDEAIVKAAIEIEKVRAEKEDRKRR
jgi:hypothetical protein